MIVQCLGGWCSSRDDCNHYHAPLRVGRMPIERLCGPVEEPERQKAGKVDNHSRPVAIVASAPIDTHRASTTDGRAA
jgi:hypothetical protein